MSQSDRHRIEVLQSEISDLKRQWPAHSVPPHMLMRLDDLEEELEKELALKGSSREPKPLWTCPECGHQFVTPNTFHSCGIFSIDDHFAGKDLIVHHIFDALKTAVERFGPVTVYAQKTRIVFQVRTRFVAVVPRKKWLTGHIWLKKESSHPRIYRIEMFTFRDFGHQFRLHTPDDIDDAFTKLLHEAYALASR